MHPAVNSHNLPYRYSHSSRSAIFLSAIILAFLAHSITPTASWVAEITNSPLLGGNDVTVFGLNHHRDPTGGLWGRQQNEICGQQTISIPGQSRFTKICRLRHTSLAFGIIGAFLTALILFWEVMHMDHGTWGLLGSTNPALPAGNRGTRGLMVILGFICVGICALICWVTMYKAFDNYYDNVGGVDDWDPDFSFGLVIVAWILSWVAAAVYWLLHRRELKSMGLQAPVGLGPAVPASSVPVNNTVVRPVV